MRFLYMLLLILVGRDVLAVCYNENDPRQSCRYPQGDEWCRSNNLPPYAYRDKDCIEAPPGKKWLQIASRETPIEAWELARVFKKQIPTTKVFRSENGWYVVALGQIDKKQQKEIINILKEQKYIPQDSLFVTGRKWLIEIPDRPEYIVDSVVIENKTAPTQIPSNPSDQQVKPPEQTNLCAKLRNNSYIVFEDFGPDEKIRYVCYIVKDDLNLQGIITLKHLTNGSDWDLLIGTHFDFFSEKMSGEIINNKNNDGSVDEIAWLPSNSEKEYTIIVYPKTDTPSRACLIFHRFDANKVLSTAAIMAAIQTVVVNLISSEDESQESKDDNSRMVALGLSILNDRSLALIGYDMILNEISTQLANTFGGGSFLFTFGVNFFGGYLEESGKYLFNKNMRCAN